MRITGIQRIEIEITRHELAHAIMEMIQQYVGKFDDAGCDWFTKDSCTYISEEGWKVSDDPRVAALVDAFNVVWHNEVRKLK